MFHILDTVSSSASWSLWELIVRAAWWGLHFLHLSALSALCEPVSLPLEAVIYHLTLFKLIFQQLFFKVPSGALYNTMGHYLFGKDTFFYFLPSPTIASMQLWATHALLSAQQLSWPTPFADKNNNVVSALFDTWVLITQLFPPSLSVRFCIFTFILWIVHVCIFCNCDCMFLHFYLCKCIFLKIGDCS